MGSGEERQGPELGSCREKVWKVGYVAWGILEGKGVIENTLDLKKRRWGTKRYSWQCQLIERVVGERRKRGGL